MAGLSRAARAEIKAWGECADRGARPTIAGYIRHYFGDDATVWGGDSCGCADDRCIGFHHDENDECGCFPVYLREYACGVRGHQWSEQINVHDYGNGPISYRLCTFCSFADYLPAVATA